jgi:hypothetical protein
LPGPGAEIQNRQAGLAQGFAASGERRAGTGFQIASLVAQPASNARSMLRRSMG